MRLLKTCGYGLVEAHDLPDTFPQYAILSHTWISPKDEITYQDMKNRKEDIENDIYKQKGWSKLRAYCDRAAKDGWEWAWMDTCCIDKTNPADTQEAINAMFRWYQNAGICYAYLEDVNFLKAFSLSDLGSDEEPDEVAGSENVACFGNAAHAAIKPIFTRAKWFSRGWTLQELLAPNYLVFVDQEWRRIGCREDWAAEIRESSRIEARHLTGFNPRDFRSCSIAMRLSWASRRKTTVEEDETYSLVGLFAISLPLIYGEGRLRAFNRLQRELITVYNDDSIFAWRAEPCIETRPLSSTRKDTGSSILASSSKQFLDASKIEAYGHYYNTFNMTNRGLEMRAKLWRHKSDLTLFLICLGCGVKNRGDVVIQIRHTYDTYVRTNIDEICYMDTINHHDWEEEGPSAPILVQANDFLDSPTGGSVFFIEKPCQVRIGAKYFMQFDSSTALGELQMLNADPRSNLFQGFKEHEISAEPNQTIFVNIDLLNDGLQSKLDVIINLTANGFPSVGIMGRGSGEWERLGDPLGQASQTYKMLADYLHFKMRSEPTYERLAMDETSSRIVGVTLCPKPSHGRMPNVPVEMAHLREYWIRIKIQENNCRRNEDFVGIM